MSEFKKPKTVVVNRRYDGYDVYVGRPTIWGNPFVVGKDGNREEVIDKYRKWAVKQPHLMKNLYRLKGKRIACWCTPEPCHADVLAELADRS